MKLTVTIQIAPGKNQCTATREFTAGVTTETHVPLTFDEAVKHEYALRKLAQNIISAKVKGTSDNETTEEHQGAAPISIQSYLGLTCGECKHHTADNKCTMRKKCIFFDTCPACDKYFPKSLT